MEPYSAPGVLFGGVDAGPAFPLNALNRFTDVGGFIMPFVGYKFFQDRDLQLNPGIVGGVQFFGMGASDCFTNSSCFAFHNSQDHATYALSFQAGPRVSLPVGPVELFGDIQFGVLTGLASGSAITDTSWGFYRGGINYWLTATGGSTSASARSGAGSVGISACMVKVMCVWPPPASK
jgi:hypothetical protein